MSSSDNMVTPEATLSFVKVWVAEAYRDKAGNVGDTKKYQCTFLIPKSADTSPLEAAYAQVLAADFPDGLPKGALPGGLRDGADEYPNDPFYADKWVLSASQTEDRFSHSNILDSKMQQILDKSQLYSGAIGKGVVGFYGYFGGKQGIGCSLHGVMKIRDGESLGGGAVDAAAIFGGAGDSPAAAGNTPSVPPKPSAPPKPPAAPKNVMTAAANGVSYEAYIKEGWTDEQLVENGLMGG